MQNGKTAKVAIAVQMALIRAAIRLRMQIHGSPIFSGSKRFVAWVGGRSAYCKDERFSSRRRPCYFNPLLSA